MDLVLFLFLVLASLLGIFLGLQSCRFIGGICQIRKSQGEINLESFNENRREAKERSKELILRALQKSSKITNDEVQELLEISDATATRYLDELEKEAKIKQVGGSQKDAFYQLK